MTFQLCRWITICFIALLQSISTSSCDRSPKPVATMELKRADGKPVSLALLATPKTDSLFGELLGRAYFIEYNGERHEFAKGGFETTYACVVQSPDKNRVVVLSAFRGAASGMLELNLNKETVKNINRTGRRLKDYEGDGWSIHNWIKPAADK